MANFLKQDIHAEASKKRWDIVAMLATSVKIGSLSCTVS